MSIYCNLLKSDFQDKQTTCNTYFCPWCNEENEICHGKKCINCDMNTFYFNKGTIGYGNKPFVHMSVFCRRQEHF